MPLTLTSLRRTLADMDAPELRALLEDLYKASAANKRLLTAKLEGDNSELRAKLESELKKAFGTPERTATFRVSGAKKALADYVKVAAPLDALDAELRYVEAAMDCLGTYGGWPDNNYSSTEKVWEGLLKRAKKLPDEALPHDRFKAITKRAYNVGLDGIPYEYEVFRGLHDDDEDDFEE